MDAERHPMGLKARNRREYVLGENIETFKLDATLGLAPDAKWTMAINIRQLVNLLSLPRPLRGHNCFSSHIIRMVDRKFTPTTGTAQKFTDGPDLSWTIFASANYGLSIQRTPPTPTTWLADFIKNSLTVAVGFIPVVGPLAAVCFPLTWTAIVDPGNFEHTLRALVPIADLAMQVAAEIQKSAQKQEKKAAQPRVVSEETVKQFESIRKFEHWNVMRAVSAAVTSGEQIVDLGGDEDALPPPPPAIVSGVTKKEVVHKLEEELPAEVPEHLPLRELQPSAPFQLATQVLQHSADALASTGTNDNSAGRTVQEVCPETVIPVEQGPGDNFNWMDKYLREELS
ncbi:hypothetical protein N8T08_010869 [Aspergillus melleus]|uniref:Uncharacterized protein n=1 Tax=Aspergillus melleus TaxID=138277 RepID=A0ACC3ARJ2_9EURO|nr:hypothetical protein N8T08_010869 [Aspergillus melleus]